MLHQLNAVLNGFKPQAKRTTTDCYHRVQKLPELTGLERTFHPDKDDDQGLPPQGNRVRQLAADAVGEAAEALKRLFDLQHMQDVSNCVARADIVLDNGTVLLADVPVTTLMFLRKQLADWRTFVDKLPVHDAADKWTWSDGHGAWAAEPFETIGTEKELQVITLHPGSDKHPAQVSARDIDVRRGVWRTTKLTGAMPAARVRELRDRVDRLIEAVKVAQETANSVRAAESQRAGARIFSYLLAGDN